MSRAQADQIAALQIELEETKAKLAEFEKEQAEIDSFVEANLSVEQFGSYMSKLDAAESRASAAEAQVMVFRAFVERLALVIRNPGCGSCANVSAEAAMLLDASPSPEGWVRREEVGPLLDTMHDVLEALADSGELLTRIGGDAREMAQVQSLDNLKAAAAFDAALEAWATKGGKR